MAKKPPGYDEFAAQVRSAPKGPPSTPDNPNSAEIARQAPPPRRSRNSGRSGGSRSSLRTTQVPGTLNAAGTGPGFAQAPAGDLRGNAVGANVRGEQANQQRVTALQREEALQVGRPESAGQAVERRRTLRDLQTPITQPGSFFSNLTQNDVVQFQRRQHLEKARERNELERQAFGSAGRSADAVRASLRTGQGRFADLLRRNSLSEEQRQAEAKSVADAEGVDAGRLQSVRGLRQQDEQFGEELGQRERESQRGLQGDLVGAQARIDAAQIAARGRRDRDRDPAQKAFTAQKDIVTSFFPEGEGRPVTDGEVRLFRSEADKAIRNGVLPEDISPEDVGLLQVFTRALPDLGSGVFSSAPNEPIGPQTAFELIKRAALNPGQDVITVGGSRLDTSKLEGRMAGAFQTSVERVATSFRQKAASELADNGFDPSKLEGDSKDLLEATYAAERQEEIKALRAQKPQLGGQRTPQAINLGIGTPLRSTTDSAQARADAERIDAQISQIQEEIERGPDDEFAFEFARKNAEQERFSNGR